MHPGRWNFSWGTASSRLATGHVCGHLLSSCGRIQPTVASATPGQVNLGCVRKQDEQAREWCFSVASALASCPGFPGDVLRIVRHKPLPQAALGQQEANKYTFFSFFTYSLSLSPCRGQRTSWGVRSLHLPCGFWTQAFRLGSKCLYHWAHSPALLGYFQSVALCLYEPNFLTVLWYWSL